jgi:hypothetical protein
MLFATVESGETDIVDPPQFLIPPPSKDAIFDKMELDFLTVIEDESPTIPPPCPPGANMPLAELPLIIHEMILTVSLATYTPPPSASPPEATIEFMMILVSLITAAALSDERAIPPPAAMPPNDEALFPETLLLMIVIPALTTDIIPPPKADPEDVVELYAILLAEIFSAPS